MKTHLFISLYEEKNPLRRDELLYCLKQNVLCQEIDRIHVLFDLDSKPIELEVDNKFPRDKVWVYHRRQSGRPTYRDFIDLINSNNYGFDARNDIYIIANTDIIFDPESLKLVKVSLKHHQVYALTRYDLASNRTFEDATFLNRRDSQDCWMMRGAKIFSLNQFEFHPGTAGCDNRIAKVFEEHGLEVLNPSFTIKTYHLHHSGILNYNPSHKVEGPYLLLPPTTLNA